MTSVFQNEKVITNNSSNSWSCQANNMVFISLTKVKKEIGSVLFDNKLPCKSAQAHKIVKTI